MLSDLPPGTEDYEEAESETPVERNVPPDIEKFIQSHQITFHDGTKGPMLAFTYGDDEKPAFLCYACGATCYSEVSLQHHMIGKKHTSRLSSNTTWSKSIMKEHPFFLSSKIVSDTSESPVADASHKLTSKMMEYFDTIKTALIGLEYFIEVIGDGSGNDLLMCTLCDKRGLLNAITNHITSLKHKHKYLAMHFPQVYRLLEKHRNTQKSFIITLDLVNNVCDRIEQDHGRQKPLTVSEAEFELDKLKYVKMASMAHHVSERTGKSYVEMIDESFINAMCKKEAATTSTEIKAVEPPTSEKEVVLENSRNIISNPKESTIKITLKTTSLPKEEMKDLREDLNERRAKKDLREDIEEVKRKRENPLAFSRDQPKRHEMPYRIRDSPPRGARSPFRSRSPFRCRSPPFPRRPERRSHERMIPQRREPSPKPYRKHSPHRLRSPSPRRRKSPFLVKRPPSSRRMMSPSPCRYPNIRTSPRRLSPGARAHSPDINRSHTLRSGSPRSYRRSRSPKSQSRRSRSPRSKPYRSRSPKDLPYRSRSPRSQSYRSRSPISISPPRKDSPPSSQIIIKDFYTMPFPEFLGMDLRFASVYLKKNFHKANIFQERYIKTVDSMKNALEFQEKNPEKHPLYQEEWKKFWNKRYKELKSEKIDTNTYDFKPEWIIYWSKKIKEIYDKELDVKKSEICRRLNLPLTDLKLTEFLQSTMDYLVAYARKCSNRPPIVEQIIKQEHKMRSQKLEYESQERAIERPVSRSSFGYEKEMNSERFKQKVYNRNKDPSPVSDGSLSVHSDISDGSLDSIPQSVTRTSKGKARHRDPSYSEANPIKSSEDINVISVLRLLTALENFLGSLGTKVVDLLALALKMEKEKPNSSEFILTNDEHCVLFETVKEKLKGQLLAGFIEGNAVTTTKKAIQYTASLIHMASKMESKKKSEKESRTVIKDVAVTVEGIGAVEKAAIAHQIATALIAQGRTNVTTEELESLVNSVVGMVQGEETKAQSTNVLGGSKKSDQSKSTVNALQMLQSAYTSRIPSSKPPVVEEEPVASAIEGLSDSDLETLLQNFEDLSADEQNGLIKYLKNLEKKDPKRVEKLRKFISSDSNFEAASREKSPFSLKETKNITMPEATKVKDSDDDDDDYSFDDVLKSASAKVKVTQAVDPKPKSTNSSSGPLDINTIMSLLGPQNKAVSEKPNQVDTSYENISKVLGLVATLSSQNKSDSNQHQSTFPQSSFTQPNSQPNILSNISMHNTESNSQDSTHFSGEYRDQRDQFINNVNEFPSNMENDGYQMASQSSNYGGQSMRGSQMPYIGDVRGRMPINPYNSGHMMDANNGMGYENPNNMQNESMYNNYSGRNQMNNFVMEENMQNTQMSYNRGYNNMGNTMDGDYGDGGHNMNNRGMGQWQNYGRVGDPMRRGGFNRRGNFNRF